MQRRASRMSLPAARIAAPPGRPAVPTRPVNSMKRCAPPAASPPRFPSCPRAIGPSIAASASPPIVTAEKQNGAFAEGPVPIAFKTRKTETLSPGLRFGALDCRKALIGCHRPRTALRWLAGKSAVAQGLGAPPLKLRQEAVPPAPPLFDTLSPGLRFGAFDCPFVKK